MNILPSEMPKDARGRPLKGGWPIHAKGQHDLPDDAPGCKKRRYRKDYKPAERVTAWANPTDGMAKGVTKWLIADCWREDDG